jgi:hypothetical protein
MTDTLRTSANWSELDEVMEDFELPSTSRLTPETIARAQAAVADRKVRRFMAKEGESAEDYILRVKGKPRTAVGASDGITGEVTLLGRAVSEVDPKLRIKVVQKSGWFFWQVVPKSEAKAGGKPRGRKPKSETNGK